MNLTQFEIEGLQNHFTRRRHRKLRQEFVGERNNAEQRGRYFDKFIDHAEGLSGSTEADHLILLELGWLQNLPLDQCSQFKECLVRGKWYGRRFWLRNQLERVVERVGNE